MSLPYYDRITVSLEHNEDVSFECATIEVGATWVAIRYGAKGKPGEVPRAVHTVMYPTFTIAKISLELEGAK